MTLRTQPVVTYAIPEWSEDVLPRSAEFDDVYYSARDGRAESEYVFLQGNGLPKRWQNHSRFVIAETGFGTGLNFYLTCQQWLEHAPKDATLHYLSFEKHPLPPDAIRRALKCWPDLAKLAEPLLRHYPLLIPGPHRLVVHPRIRLTLIWGDVAEWLPRLSFSADAWYLDGFAPSCNPAMWQEPILHQVAAHTAPGGSVATFTAAGDVRRGLISAGFSVRKRPGFGHKREMLCGEMPGGLVPEPAMPDHVIVVGAGIAGASTAHALAERGISVTLLDRAEKAGSQASGNPSGILFPRIAKQWLPEIELYLIAYAYMLRQLAQWREGGLEFTFETPGMLWCARDEKHAARLETLQSALGLSESVARRVSAEEASQLAGIPLTQGGAWFPHGSWLNPRELCEALAEHPGITRHFNTTIDSISLSGDGWQLIGDQGQKFEASAVVLATAQATGDLLPDLSSPLHVSRGQITQTGPSTSNSLQSILCYSGYAIPQPEGGCLLGATYRRDTESLELFDEDHAENLSRFHDLSPDFLSGSILTGGRAAFRCTVPGRLPVIGEMLNMKGMYLNLAHSSRGLLSAPLGAEMIASALRHEPSPVSIDVTEAVAPVRLLTTKHFTA